MALSGLRCRYECVMEAIQTKRCYKYTAALKLWEYLLGYCIVCMCVCVCVELGLISQANMTFHFKLDAIKSVIFISHAIDNREFH